MSRQPICVQQKTRLNLTFSVLIRCRCTKTLVSISAATLRSFLRQDPDTIMVGEIRDFETAEIAIKASLTGHLVLSTLHTNDAPATVSRLLNMGVEPFLVAVGCEPHLCTAFASYGV